MSGNSGNKKGIGPGGGVVGGASGSGRSLKGHPPSGDFIALGNKPPARQGSPSIVGPPTKKPHVEEEDASEALFSNPIRISQAARPGGGGTSSDVTMTSSSKLSSTQPIDVRVSELVPSVNEALETKNTSKAIRFVLGGIKLLKNARLKADLKLNESLTTLVLNKPELFSNTSAVIEGLMSILRRETAAIFKTRSEPVTYTLACNLLLISLKDSKDWPEGVAKLYIDDAIGDRTWIDLKSCKKLTDNIATLFNTQHLERVSDTDVPEQSSQMETSENELTKIIDSIPVQPRFSATVCKSLRGYIMQSIKDQLGKRGSQPSDAILRNHIKFLRVSAGLAEVRLFVAEKFEQWIQNSKMIKPVNDLLCTVALNSSQHSTEDIKVLETFLNVKLKTRLFSQNYITCIKEFILANSNYIQIVVKRTVTNELTQTIRQPTNIQLLSVCCQQWPDETANIIGSVFQDFFCRKEDYLRTLRGFLRELVRRNENFPISVFARALMQQRSEQEFANLDQTYKEKMAISLADIIACCCMLTITTTIKEAYTNYSKGDKTMVPQLKTLFDVLGVIQRDSVWWVHSILPKFLRPQPMDYKLCLRKVLFLEPHESYCKDNWPSEMERNTVLQLMTECTLSGDTLMRILVIGLDKDLPLSPSDAIDIADKLVARAANVHTNDIPRVPSLERKELFSAIFDITAYRPPSSITFPKSYKPPNLAISKLYWKGWILLLVLGAFNPESIGSIGWNEYPTLQAMMIMVMTNNYSFPVSLVKPKGIKMTLAQEEQLAQEEKDTILKYENYLAVTSAETKVTETTSYLLNQVTQLDPKGPVRRIPSSAIDLIKTVNNTLKLGQLLCQCREPDFLLEIIQQQGTSQAMSWLRNLIDGNQSSLDVLPVTCLCEFLLNSYQEKGIGQESSVEHEANSHRAQYKRKQHSKVVHQHEQMINRLQTLVCSSSTSPASCLDVLQYFIGKLSSPYSVQALEDILCTKSDDSANIEEEEGNIARVSTSWLLCSIPSLSVFPAISSSVIELILKASVAELNAELFIAYISFITRHTSTAMIPNISLELAVIISQRFSFFKMACEMNQQHKDVMLASLLSMFRVTMDTHVQYGYQPPPDYKESELSILCLPTINDKCEIVIVTQFLEAIFLSLSLVHSSVGTVDSQFLLQLLLPDDSVLAGQALAMSTREHLPLVREKTFEFIICNENDILVSQLVQQFQPKQLCRFLFLYGVPCSNMDVVLGALDQTKVETGDTKAILYQIELHQLRGCTNGHLYSSFLKEKRHFPQSSTGHLTLKSLLASSRPQRKMSLFSPLQTRQVPPLASSLEEALDQVFIHCNYESIDRLLSFLLCLLTRNGSMSELQAVNGIITNVGKLLSRSPDDLNAILKERGICRLLYLLSRVVLLCCSDVARNNYVVILRKYVAVNPPSIVSTCLDILSPTAVRVPSYAQFVSDFSAKISSQTVLAPHLEKRLLSFASYAISNGLEQSYIELLLQLKENPLTKGILCDLIDIIDPELASPLVHAYLFSCTDISYLSEKLLHQVSLPILRNVLSKGLTNQIKNINSTILLNLLWSCLHSPTLWQGKVKKEAVIDSNLSLGIDKTHHLKLSLPQLYNVIDNVFQEMASVSNVNPRLPLLITCFKGKLDIAAKYITQHSASDVSSQLLLLLYHGDEHLGKYLTHSANNVLKCSLPSRMDCYLHYLLAAMTTVSSDENGIEKMSAASLLCRHIAIAHPFLMLRQLPLLGWLLRGRAHLSSKQFRSHQSVFNNSFHLLHLLEPAVFNQSQDIECCLEPFMDYLKHQCLNNSVSNSLLGKLLPFMSQYCQLSRQTAQLFFSKHYETLNGLKNVYPKHQKALQDILDIIPSHLIPKFVQDSYSDSFIDTTPSVQSNTNSISSSTGQSHSYTQVLPFIRKLEYSQTQEGILQVLKDLDDSSLRSVEILQYFIPILCKIIQSSDISCVKIAHEVILRHLRHSPTSIDEILPSILACLHSPNFTIVMAAVPFIPELILLSSAKDAVKLMSILFKLAIISPINCSQVLEKTITLLTSHVAI